MVTKKGKSVFLSNTPTQRLEAQPWSGALLCEAFQDPGPPCPLSPLSPGIGRMVEAGSPASSSSVLREGKTDEEQAISF